MVGNIILGMLVMAVCLALQLVLVALAMRYYRRHDYLVERSSFTSSLRVIFGVMALLVIGNTAQIAIWALLFCMLGEFSEFSEAVYHSAVNFATLGYGDIVMSEKHKLLGPFEAMNGVLMIGVSTSALMTAFQDTFKRTVSARQAAKQDQGQPPDRG